MRSASHHECRLAVTGQPLCGVSSTIDLRSRMFFQPTWSARPSFSWPVGIQLIEGAAPAVGRTGVAAGEVVFSPRRELSRRRRRCRPTIQCPAHALTASDAQRAGLDSHFHAVVEPGGKFAHPARANRRGRQIAGVATFRLLRLIAAPEYVGLDGRLGNPIRRRSVRADERLPLPLLSTSPSRIRTTDVRERIEPEPVGFERGPDAVEAPCRVDPCEMPDQALLAEEHLLTADSQCERALLVLPMSA